MNEQAAQARALGFWSALVITLLGAAYFLVVLGALLAGHFSPPREWLQLFGGIVSLLACPVLVAMMAGLHTLTQAPRRVFSLLAFGFTLLFAAAVSINRFTQLGVVRQSLAAGSVEGIGWFLPYGERSVMLGLEFLGWSWFLGMALLCCAPLFSGGRRQRWLRALALLYAVPALTSAVGFLLGNPLSLLGFLAWGLVLYVFTGLLAAHFRWGGDRDHQGPSARAGTGVSRSAGGLR